MATFSVNLKLDNASFDDGDGPRELRRVLANVGHEVPDNLFDGRFSTVEGRIRDYNGNTIGTWVYEGDDT